MCLCDVGVHIYVLWGCSKQPVKYMLAPDQSLPYWSPGGRPSLIAAVITTLEAEIIVNFSLTQTEHRCCEADNVTKNTRREKQFEVDCKSVIPK